MKKKLIPFISLILLLIIVVTGCRDKETEVELTEEQKSYYYMNKSIFDAVSQYYYWYKLIPPKLDYKQQPEIFFNLMLYKAMDRWSFIIDKGSFYMGFLQGTVYGMHGFDVMNDQNGQLRVSMVYPKTIAYQAGVRRGWKVLKANNNSVTFDNFYDNLSAFEPGTMDDFEFINDTGSVSLSLKKEDFTAPSVLYFDTIQSNGKLVGYLVFNEFRGSDSQAELDSAFTFFNTVGANELVLDMRYNPGGMNETAHYLGNLIAGNIAPDDIFVKYSYNDKLARDFNESVKLQALPQSINLPQKRIYIIATGNTASASEIIINCLKPFMSVYTIGSQTHGKPMGMNLLDLRYYDFILAPISFAAVNKNDQGEYFTGIPVDCNTADDITHDFGDPNEWCLAQALSHINTGSFSATLKSTPLHAAPQVMYSMRKKKPLSINKIITIE